MKQMFSNFKKWCSFVKGKQKQNIMDQQTLRILQSEMSDKGFYEHFLLQFQNWLALQKNSQYFSNIRRSGNKSIEFEVSGSRHLRIKLIGKLPDLTKTFLFTFEHFQTVLQPDGTAPYLWVDMNIDIKVQQVSTSDLYNIRIAGKQLSDTKLYVDEIMDYVLQRLPFNY